MKVEKTTNLRQSGEKRRYDDACGLAHALELIGDRWAMLILRELAYGPRRFSELRADLPGLSELLNWGNLLSASGILAGVDLNRSSAVATVTGVGAV